MKRPTMYNLKMKIRSISLLSKVCYTYSVHYNDLDVYHWKRQQHIKTGYKSFIVQTDVNIVTSASKHHLATPNR